MPKNVTKTEFRRLSAHLKPSSYANSLEYLGDLYNHLKHKIDRYTYTKYTQNVGLGDCNAMHLIVHSKRRLTISAARKIINSIGLKKHEKRYFLQMVLTELEDDPTKKMLAFQKLLEIKSLCVENDLSADQLEFFKDWYNAAIYETLRQEGASDDPEWLGNNLISKVTATRVRKSLKLLEKLGYVSFDEVRGRLYPTEDVISTGSEVTGLAVMSYHQQMIKMAKDSIVDTPPEDRQITSVTVSISDDLRREIAHKIDMLRHEIAEMSKRQGGVERVCQINFQIFPLGKESSKKG